MRIAWITPFLPAPANSGGRIRVSAFADALAEEELVLFARLDDNDIIAPRDGERLGPFSAAYTRPTRPVDFRILPRIPERVRRFPTELSRLVVDAHSKAKWDAIVIEHCYAYVDLPKLPGVRVVLNEHNVESEYFRRRMRVSPTIFPASAHQFFTWRSYERARWRAASAVTAVSEDDARKIRRVRPDSGIVFPNGVHVEASGYVAPSKRRGSKILFLGMMNYEPNIQASLVLAQKILPLVREQIPEATLTIAGRDPGHAVKALSSDAVTVTGAIERLGPLFDDHAAFAMPIALGAGTSLKALEALSRGLPVVAFPFAMRAHPLVPDVHYLPAANIHEFARALVRILSRQGELDELALRGRQVVEGMSWSQIGRSFAEFIRAR